MELLGALGLKLLWIPVAAGLVWMVGPLVMFWSSLRRMRTEAAEDPNEAARPTGDADLDRVALDFRARRFQPVGWMIDQCLFFTPVHWKFRGPRELVLGSPDRTTHAVAYRMGNLSVKMSAHTALEGGGLLTTSMVRTKYKGDLGARYHRLEIDETTPGELLLAHEHHVREICQQRGLRPRPVSVDELVNEIAIISRPLVARARLARLYIIPVLVLFLVARLLWGAGHLSSGALALGWLLELINFALLRVIALPEFTHVWKALAMIALLLLPAPSQPPKLSSVSSSTSAVRK